MKTCPNIKHMVVDVDTANKCVKRNQSKKDLAISLAGIVQYRLEQAEKAYTNTTDWYNEDVPNIKPAMSYWEWIEDAQNNLLEAIKEI